MYPFLHVVCNSPKYLSSFCHVKKLVIHRKKPDGLL